MSKCLPNFLIVGAAKSGTSSLHNYLRKHHDVFMPNYIHSIKVKEPRFFVKNSIEGRVNNYEIILKTTKNYLVKVVENLQLAKPQFSIFI